MELWLLNEQVEKESWSPEEARKFSSVCVLSKMGFNRNTIVSTNLLSVHFFGSGNQNSAWNLVGVRSLFDDG